ncbi:MAG: pduD [Klenkia sp.]|nr:pduD [Klenkia sp.]
MRDEPVERPSVVLHHAPDAAPAVLREIAAGAEEEGVPLRVVAAAGGGAVALAAAAAQASRLSVGVGVTAAAVVVHHAQLPADRPALQVAAGGDRVDWRRAGRVAARVVTGLPLV